MAKATKSESFLPVITGDKEQLQEKLRSAISMIDKKLEELSGEKTVSKGTNFSGTAVMYNDFYNLQIGVSTDVNLPNLITLAGKIRTKIAEYNNAAEEAGLKSYPVCTFNGHPAKDLLSFVEMRIKLIANTNVITQLKAEKKKLETFLSEDDRLAATLASAMNLISGKE